MLTIKMKKKTHNNQHKKASDKIQHPIMIKLSQTKNIRELIKYSPLWSRTRQISLVSPRLFNPFENQPVQWSKEQKRKEEIKLTLVTNNIFVFVENPKKYTKKQKLLMNFSKVTEYKVTCSYTKVTCSSNTLAMYNWKPKS